MRKEKKLRLIKENKIVDKIDFVYPLKNGITAVNKKAQGWVKACLKEKK